MATTAFGDEEWLRPVSEEFFVGRADGIAESMLGMLLTAETDAGVVGGIITETEAYINDIDPACHLADGRTPRTEPFFSGPGTLYVYQIWGHDNLNVITDYDGHPEAVLVRALAPTHGLDLMRERRGRDARDELTTGPGRLTGALGITKAECNDVPLAESPLALYETGYEPAVAVDGRIGISEATDWPLRYCVADSASLSESVEASEDLDYAAVEDGYRHLDARAETE